MVSRGLTRLGALGDAWSAAGVAALALVLGLFQLGQPSLWVDESFTARAVGHSYRQLLSEHHLFYYSFMKPWSALFGTGEFALRFPSVIAGAAACALLVPLGNRLMGRPVGALAGLVLAVNPFVVQWSQQARSYSFVMLAAIVATWRFVVLREQRSRRSWAWYTAALGVLLVLQPLSAGLVAAAHFLAARGFRIRIVASGVTVCFLASGYLLGVYARDSTGGTLVWNVDPTVGSVSRASLELSGALGVGLALSVVGLALVRRERLLLASWALAPLALAVLATPIGKVFVDRYLLVSAPAFALLVAAALHRLRGWWRVGAAGAFAAGTVAGLAIWYGPDGSQNWRGEDWRAATEFAMRHGGATVEPFWAGPAFTYYGGVERDTGLHVIWSENPRDFAGNWPLDVGFGGRLRVQERR